jgi:hypothetical protein
MAIFFLNLLLNLNCSVDLGIPNFLATVFLGNPRLNSSKAFWIFSSLYDFTFNEFVLHFGICKRSESYIFTY